jgi:HAD superfamily hydrolase (TIGR01490 family)
MSAAAFFDVDGTLTRTTILHPLIWYQRAHLAPLRYALWITGLACQVPRYLWIDRRSRSRVNVVIYRRYAGLPAAGLRDWHRRTFADNLQRRLFPKALDGLAEHRRAGRRIVLVTGGLDFVMAPLAEHVGAADVIATHLVERNGVFTGEIDGPPLADGRKAELMRAYAEKHGIDLAESYAYGDSYGDLPMLECVGHAVAVSPDERLRPVAVERGWGIESWQHR